MSRYHKQNSNRKAKARARRQAQEMCASLVHYPDLGGTYALTPEEFCTLELRPKRMRTEPTSNTVKRRERAFKEPRQLSATGKTKQHIAA